MLDLIGTGRVLVGGAPASNPDRLVAPHETITVRTPPPRHVSRGGDKLAAALDRFDVDVSGKRVLDAGSSTGGFTDCALQAGAGSVVAVDVGRGQLHQRLRDDARVEVHERTNIRHLRPGDLGPPADVVVADLSFISLTTVLDAMFALSEPHAEMVLLVKPQFEATRDETSAGRGVITDPAIWRRVLEEISDALLRRGATIMGIMTSPLRGAEGNVEFLLHARRRPVPDATSADAGALIDIAVTEAERR